VHLIHAELHDELRAAGFVVSAGQMGRMLQRAVSICSVCRLVHGCIWATQRVELTGLRNPCVQLDGFQSGLMAAVLGRDEHGKLIRLVSWALS